MCLEFVINISTFTRDNSSGKRQPRPAGLWGDMDSGVPPMSRQEIIAGVWFADWEDYNNS